MFITAICLCFIILGLLFIGYKFTTRAEPFSNDKSSDKSSDKKNSFQKILNDAKKEINATKNKWLTYNASKKKDEYVLTPYKNNEIVYKIDISKSDNKKIYVVKRPDNTSAGTNAVQEDNLPNSYGRFEKGSAKIEFRKGEERITISINNGETTIIGYGGFSNNTSYPEPWNQVLPIVYKEGNSVIGTMDYAGNIKNLKATSEDIPVEIIISKDNKKYLPLFFKVYVLTQKYMSSLK